MPGYGEAPFWNNMQQSTTHIRSQAFSFHRLLHCCQAMQCPFALRPPPIIHTMPLVVMVYRCVLCAIIRSSTTVSSIRGCEQCSIAAAMSSSSKCSAAGLSSPAEMGGNGRWEQSIEVLVYCYHPLPPPSPPTPREIASLPSLTLTLTLSRPQP
jgi:hypothetical protein